jgi:HEAT repeat protein
LAQTNATSAVEPIAESMQDPEPDVRFEAVTALSALTPDPGDLVYRISSLLDDQDIRVRARTASILLRHSSRFGRRSRDQQSLEKARAFLRYTAAMGELSSREQAIRAMGDWGDAEAFDFLVNELKDRSLPIRIRRVVLVSLAQIQSAHALPYLIQALGHPDVSIQRTAAGLLGQVGQPAIEPVLTALQNPGREEGALLALQHLPMPPEKPVQDFAQAAVARAVDYDSLRRGLQQTAQKEAVALLSESLHKKSNQFGIRALRAIGLLGNRDAMNLAIDILSMRSSAQRANVIEALESIHARWRKTLQPLMRLWEDEFAAPNGKADWQQLINDEDPWIRDCALFAAHQLGEKDMENIATLSLMERILFLKRIPLFENLAPADIKQVSALAQEESFTDGVSIVREGEIGDVMFIILSGEVRVLITKDHKEVELARRRAGQYVGEMALISREPRSATVRAVGEVRALCIDQKSFESLLRDRPDASLAVIQVLCERLKEADAKLHLSATQL